MLLNIVILPDKKIKNLAIQFSKKLADKFPVEFILAKNDYLPHITLYQAEFPEKNIEKIKLTIKDICKKNFSFKINLLGFSNFEKFIFWNIKSGLINKLHQQVVGKLNPLRQGLIMNNLLSVNKNLYTGVKEDIKKYGSLLIGKNYLPHLTITCLRNKSYIKKALQELKNNNSLVFTVNKIHIGLLDKFGTVRKIIFTEDLQ